MNIKLLNNIRFALTDSAVREPEVCRKFGVNRLEDLDDSQKDQAYLFVLELKARIRKAKRHAKCKAKHSYKESYYTPISDNRCG